MNLRTAGVEFFFWIHLPFVLVWILLFFIPTSLWPGKITFHFWYILLLILIQVGWGILLSITTGIKNYMICPLTTAMQSLRGHPLNSKENIQHTYITEVSNKLKVKISGLAVSILALVTFGIVTLQFIFI